MFFPVILFVALLIGAMKFIITIDGPAGSGKSTIAKMLAKKLGAEHLSSGKIYRAMALLYKREKGDIKRVIEKSSEINLDKLSELEPEISGEDIGKKASEISRIPEIRKKSDEIQRKIVFSSQKSFVVDGRDEGTVVFPDADVKIYLDASLEERAKRRLLDEKKKKKEKKEIGVGEGGGGEEETTENTFSQEELSIFMKLISERDKMDRERDISPLRIPEGAIYIDSTGKTPEEVLTEILEEIRRRKPEILHSLNVD